MDGSLLRDAFGHHFWATLRVIDACRQLDPGLLATSAPGTYGSIIDTMRHLVGADAGYLSTLTDGRVPRIDDPDEAQMGLAELRAVTERHGAAWASLLAEDLDPEAVVIRRRDDGSETQAPLGIRLAQALHHGTDHRSQICTALTTLGVQPPEIDVWDYAWQDGRLTETPPTA